MPTRPRRRTTRAPYQTARDVGRNGIRAAIRRANNREDEIRRGIQRLERQIDATDKALEAFVLRLSARGAAIGS